MDTTNGMGWVEIGYACCCAWSFVEAGEETEDGEQATRPSSTSGLPPPLATSSGGGARWRRARFLTYRKRLTEKNTSRPPVICSGEVTRSLPREHSKIILVIDQA